MIIFYILMYIHKCVHALFLLKNEQDIQMVQIAINNFKSVGIIVASRPKMHMPSALAEMGGQLKLTLQIRPYSQLQMDVFQKKLTDQLRSHMKQIKSIN